MPACTTLVLLASIGVVAAPPTADAPAQKLPPPPGPHIGLKPEAHRKYASFRSRQPIVGTTYFYWYDVRSGAHIRDGDGTDAMTTHPPTEAMADLSYLSPAWHHSQLRDMSEAGIDFLMPVFWGVPGDYNAWSFAGLPPLVAAHDRMLAEHDKDSGRPRPPMIGLFYDTSTLKWNQRQGAGLGPGEHVDLTTPRGREWFYMTIRDFFSMIPPQKWARVDGRPIVFLYTASFAKAVDARLFDDTRKRFEKDFGTDLFLVRHVDWPGRADGWYTWGGALGLKIGDVVAALGPGYDHSAVPGREKLIVERRDGAFYDEQWSRLLRMNPQRRPWIVHVETWNEWHEGTDIARSQESGDLYIRKTARYARMFHEHVRLPRSGPYADAAEVRWTPSATAGLELRPSSGDGRWERNDGDGYEAIVSTAPQSDGPAARYLYFRVDDSFLYDEADCTVEVAVTYRQDGGCEQFAIQYDSDDPTAGPNDGAFRDGPSYPVGRSGWRRAHARLDRVRFANRTNDADFRLAVHGGPGKLTVREVVVRRSPGER